MKIQFFKTITKILWPKLPNKMSKVKIKWFRNGSDEIINLMKLIDLTSKILKNEIKIENFITYYSHVNIDCLMRQFEHLLLSRLLCCTQDASGSSVFLTQIQRIKIRTPIPRTTPTDIQLKISVGLIAIFLWEKQRSCREFVFNNDSLQNQIYHLRRSLEYLKINLYRIL